jgi:hypothetical protein
MLTIGDMSKDWLKKTFVINRVEFNKKIHEQRLI